MAIIVVCPNPQCGVRLTLENERAGTTMDCPQPKCKRKLNIPTNTPRDPLPASLRAKLDRLNKLLANDYLVAACTRCLETQMQLIDISPNARSIKYQCVHCGKRTHAPAGTRAASQSIELWGELLMWVEDFNRTALEPFELSITFETPATPLPFETTTRTPIPQAARNEIWRRDGGKCVSCGTKENLQFDHIIPVARGGATTVANLQLLCRSCNLAKQAKV